MPKKLIGDIIGEIDTTSYAEEPANDAAQQAQGEAQPADAAVVPDAAAAPEAAPQETI